MIFKYIFNFETRFLPNSFALFLQIFSETVVCNVFSETIADDRSAFMAIIDCTLVLPQIIDEHLD